MVGGLRRRVTDPLRWTRAPDSRAFSPEQSVTRRRTPGTTARGQGASAEGVTRRGEIRAGPDHPGGHPGLGGLAPGTGVVGLLVADVAVHLQHAGVVAEHVVGDG